MMATAVQKNGVQSLTNGKHIDMNTVGCVSSTVEETETSEKPSEEEQAPEIDIVINNVVCSFSVRCHLNLKEIATHGANVEYRKENGMVTMKLRKPYTTASVWSSGKITCTGATSEDNAKIAARRFARCLQKLGFKVRFNNFRVVNVLGTCSMPFGIRINAFSLKYPKEAEYEPEIHPGVTYRLKEPKATLKIFSTGSITVTGNMYGSLSVYCLTKALDQLILLPKRVAYQYMQIDSRAWTKHGGHPSIFLLCNDGVDVIYVAEKFFETPCVSSIAEAIQHIYPLVYEFKKERTKEDEIDLELKKQKKSGVRKRKRIGSLDDELVDDFENDQDYSDEESDWVIDEALGP